MSGYPYSQPQLPLCANCGPRTGKRGHLGSTQFGHGYMVCSNACGKRLAIRLENKMIDEDKIPQSSFLGCYGGDMSRQKLRLRIKQLQHQVKALSAR